MKHADLKRAAVAHTLFAPTSLAAAVKRLGFVQADPLRAPARAQDLILRHRVKGYRDGDLDRRFHRLAVEEDLFINYGFLSREVAALLHPRAPRREWTATQHRQADDIERFVRARGHTHPGHVHETFAHGRVVNAWGGQSRAGTELLQGLHYRGRLRVARRDSGVRVYEATSRQPQPLDDAARAEALLDVVLSLYAPVPLTRLRMLTGFLGHAAVPSLEPALRAAEQRLRKTLPQVRCDDGVWLWPRGARVQAPGEAEDVVRFLAPFDPLVWDRRRFARLWGWDYRFEAYTPKAKRVRGYYALPLLWRDDVIGWANVSEADVALGFVSGAAPRGAAFRRALDEEVQRLRSFLR